MTTRLGRQAALVVTLALLAACATGQAVHKAETAAGKGDFDSAVAYYRQALASEPDRLDVKIALERTTRQAANEHVKRAKELEAQDQLAGAMAEYRLAADLDPGSTLAASKAAELDRRVRDMVEAARPQPRIDGLRQQAAASSPIPRLDPRTQVPELRFNNIAVRDLLKTISDLTGINVTYDQAPGFETLISRPYSIDIRQMSLEDVLNQVMQANGLTFKVVSAQTIFVYQDSTQNRQKYEDQYTQTFYISNADPTADLLPILTQVAAPGPTGIAPRIVVNKSSNAIVVRASAPILQLIEQLIRANDRPRPEVMVEAEILEVDRKFIRQLGLDLSQFALGLTFSPELAPPNAASTPNAFPTQPPPFNLNTISRGISANDFYLTSPTAMIRLLESNSTTRILAKPQSRGRAGEPMQLSLGDSIPIPNTSFGAAAAGGIANVPVTSVTYQEVGVNLQFTPRVTYQDEVILDALLLEKSALGPNLIVAGQSFPTIIRRRATGSLRLRDGESNLVAGLLGDDERKALNSFPGLTSIPILRSLFGNSDTQVAQTDIVMIITPHIVRSHELTPADLKPTYVGTGQNIGGSTPALISPDAIGLAPTGDAGGGAAAAGPGGQPIQAPAPGAVTTAPAPVTVAPGPAPAPPRAPGVVPIEAVPSGGAAPAAPQPAGPVRIVLTAPTSADGTLLSGGGPHTVPITISGAPPLSTIALTITYDSNIVRTPTITQGPFMSQGGVAPMFIPRVDTGRVDIAMSRPQGQPGASNAGLLAAISFVAGSPGATDMTITGVATLATGETVPIEFTSIRLVVK